MFNVGDTVMHSGMGVCRVEKIEKKEITKGKTNEFYVLKPVYENEKTTVYVPVNSDKIKLRHLLTQEDIKKIISALPENKSEWIDNDARRKEEYSKIIKNGDHIATMGVIKELYERKKEKEQSGKRLHIADEKLLGEAQKIIHQELAFTMNIELDDVADFIGEQLK